MISKRISSRKDGKSSARAAFRYGEGLSSGRTVIARIQDKSHRTRLGNFGLVDDGIYIGRGEEEMASFLDLAATEMQANCDLNTRVAADKKIAHFVISFNQEKPSEDVLIDTENSMLAALKLDKNHFASFLHSDNGYLHLHLFASRIDKLNHLGNPLWQDRMIRDRVCREIESRHKLTQDNGFHEIDERGEIVEVSRAIRRERKNKKQRLGDKAISTEKYSGTKSFQSWAVEERLGDQLKEARCWHDLHVSAALYGCEIKQRGAGYIACPIGQKGAIQLSKIGLKNLPEKFGQFEPANVDRHVSVQTKYKPTSIHYEGEGHYAKWLSAREDFQPQKAEKIFHLRIAQKEKRQTLILSGRAELKTMRTTYQGDALRIALSVARMQQAISMTMLSEQLKVERREFYIQLKVQGPGNSFKEYLSREAGNGDAIALNLLRKIESENATDVTRTRHKGMIQSTLSFSGYEWKATSLLQFKYRVDLNGNINYYLGRDRQITDSAITRGVHLNKIAASDPETVEVALRYALLKFGNKLKLTGPIEFQRLVVEVAVKNGLRATFEDHALEEYRIQLLEKKQQSFVNVKQETQHASNHSVQHLRQAPPPHLRNRLHNLSIGDLVFDTERNIVPLR